MQLYPYQETARARVLDAWTRHRSTLLVLPTGCGKTVVAATLAQDRAAFGRTLFLAHREELITQARDKFASWAPGLRVEIEMAESRAHLHGFYPPDVVVASVQSLSRKRRLARFAPDAFDTVFVDEAHHATANTYRGILDHFPSAHIVGITATPDRGDEEALGQVFQSVAFSYEMRQAIDDGFLVPLRQKAVRVAGLDLSKVHTIAGDLNQGELEEQLRRDELLHHVAEPIAELAKGRKTIVFTVTVAHAHDLARVLRGYGVAADALDGTATPERRKDVLGRFRSGEVQVMCNCSLFTEGFDEPAVSCVAIARPTKSRALYAQMVGRGTRLAPGKTDLLVLDFRGNAGKHMLVSPVDLLGGKCTPREKEIAEEILEKNPAARITDALDEAKREAERLRLAEEAERQRKTQEKAARLAVGTHKTVREVDPFGMRAIGIAPRALQWGDKPMTPWQETRLLRLKYPQKEMANLSAEQATELIKTLDERRAKGLATYSQARVLARFGFGNAADLSFKRAGELITQIKEAGWRLPDHLQAEARG